MVNNKSLGEQMLRRTLDSVVETICQTDKVSLVDAAEAMGIWLQMCASMQEKGPLADAISRCVREVVIDLSTMQK